MQYRKKAITIAAWRHMLDVKGAPAWVEQAAPYDLASGCRFITTLEGRMQADPGDWIIKGIAGEVYPCKDAIFRATYDPVHEQGGPVAPRLLCLVGLPRSGKTTWALALHSTHGYPVVNPDSIRLAMHGQAFAAPAERWVWAMAHTMVEALFFAGHTTVILDATNTTRARRTEWISKSHETFFHVIETPRDLCVQRATGNPSLIGAIERMVAGWEVLGQDEKVFVP